MTMDNEVNEDNEKHQVNLFCRDYLRANCIRENCRFIHETPPKALLKDMFRFCHDFQNKGCFRKNCKFIHSTAEEEEYFYNTGLFPGNNTNPCQFYSRAICKDFDLKQIQPELGEKNKESAMLSDHSSHISMRRHRSDDSGPESKIKRYNFEENGIDNHVLPNLCSSCESLEHKVKLLHDNISVLLNKVADLTEKNIQLTSMNEFLLQQTTSIGSEQPCVITSRHGTSAPVSLATVSVTPVVSLAGALPTLVPTAGTPNLTLAPASSRAQLLTPASQILSVSTNQQLVGNSGALIVTSAGAQQLMQVSDSSNLMGGGQTVVAVTPAQLTLAQPTQQLISSAPQNAVQQLVQQSALQSQLASSHQAATFSQQSVQQLAAQQSAQHLAAAQQSAQHLAVAAQQTAQQLVKSAQQLAVQQSAQQQLAVQQSAQQQLVPSAQQLVHQTSTQQITISNTSQPLALTNTQPQPLTFPIISQSIISHS